MKRTKRQIMQQAYKKGFIDGFLTSGEGYNGEYMLSAKDLHTVTREDVEREFFKRKEVGNE